MEENSVKIGFLQFAPVLGDRQGTMQRIERLLDGCGETDIK
ncbi:MAG: hypothetical protein ACOC6B_01760 [Thermodesulfobacteriota bacterium]